MSAIVQKPKKSLRARFVKNLRTNWVLYLFILPAFVYITVLHYFPLYGIQIAFRDFKASRGIWGSKWVGWKYFQKFFNSYNCWQMIRNTLVISLYQLLTFPVPILLALVIHYTTNIHLKKVTQMVTYAPHFISVVVLVGMMLSFFSQDGVVNQLLNRLFGTPMKDYMSYPEYWRSMFVWSGVWQNAGYNAIIYIAALTSVSYELHEAAIVDGASLFKRVRHIDIPAIMPTIIILLIMQCGKIMSVGYQKVYLMQNDLNTPVSEIISVYIYKMGLRKGQYSLATAIGLFNNVINFSLVLFVNKIANKVSGSGLW